MKRAVEGTGLGTLLRNLVEHLDGGVEAMYEKEGLDCRSRFTPVIRHLEQNGPSSIRQIATANGLTHSAISQTVSEMLKKGLVSSEPGQDGRERIISFTAKAEAMLPRLHVLWRAIWAASDDLGSEVGVSLPLTIAKSLEAVKERSFEERIADRLSRQQALGRRTTRVNIASEGSP
jgi:DNA-binding MarR family transcriptional regulator